MTPRTTTGEGRKEGIEICSSKTYELQDSIGRANIILRKWPDVKTECWIKIVEHKGVNGHYTAKYSGSSVRVLALECEGVVPTGWTVRRNFAAESIAGFIFYDVDLSEGSWADYDDVQDLEGSVKAGLKGGVEAGFPVSISNVECTVE